MSHALASPFQTHVVSINWSRDVITTILSETLSDSPRWVALFHHRQNAVDHVEKSNTDCLLLPARIATVGCVEREYLPV